VPEGRDIQMTSQPSAARATSGKEIGSHAFISYVREDSRQVDRLQAILQAAGIPVWRDTADLWPGEDWRARIRSAINDNALVFLACFSATSLAPKRATRTRKWS